MPDSWRFVVYEDPLFVLESEAPLLWPARVLWFVLPLSLGFVMRDALASWSSGPTILAAAMLYAAWLAGLVALVALHPWSFTVLRIVAPVSVLVALSGVRAAALWIALLALAHSLVVCALALHGAIAQACAQAEAYGDEVRRPLRTPPLLCLVLVIVVPVIASGVAVGPLLLAAGRVAWGVVATVLGLAVAAILARSLHSLSRRLLVFVPAGLVLSDPLTMPDPVLLPASGSRGSRSLPRSARSTASTRGSARSPARS